MKSGHGATRVKHMRRDTKRRKSFFRRTYQSETAVPVSISCTQPLGHLSISSRIWYTINNLETKQACVLAQSKHFSFSLLELDLENGKCKVASLAVSNVLTSNMHSNSLAIIFIHNSIVVLILIEKKNNGSRATSKRIYVVLEPSAIVRNTSNFPCVNVRSIHVTVYVGKVQI
jgi:hypothetical protein